MNITVLCVGKVKEKFFKDAIEEYKKRLGRFCSFEIKEVQDIKIPDNPNEAQMKEVLEKEGEMISKNIKRGSYIISLCIEGKKFSSESFAESIKSIQQESSDIVFVIGGSLGLSEKIKRMSKIKLSFSDMTFPHQLMRVILAEQIYRAFKIINNETYHK